MLGPQKKDVASAFLSISTTSKRYLKFGGRRSLVKHKHFPSHLTCYGWRLDRGTKIFHCSTAVWTSTLTSLQGVGSLAIDDCAPQSSPNLLTASNVRATSLKRTSDSKNPCWGPFRSDRF